MQRALADKPDLFHFAEDELASPFFRRNGLLFLSPDQVKHFTSELGTGKPLIAGLVRDPSLRGLAQLVTEMLDYGKQGYLMLDDIARPLNAAASTLEDVAQGRVAEFSWRGLLRADTRPLDLHRFIEVWPVLDQSALEPGGKATAAIRGIVGRSGSAPSTAPKSI